MKKETIANFTLLGKEIVELIRRALHGTESMKEGKHHLFWTYSSRLAFDVNDNDILLRGVPAFEVSIGSRIRMSGGPVVDRSTNLVAGILSIGLPPDEPVRTTTFAISAPAILQVL